MCIGEVITPLLLISVSPVHADDDFEGAHQADFYSFPIKTQGTNRVESYYDSHRTRRGSYPIRELPSWDLQDEVVRARYHISPKTGRNRSPEQRVEGVADVAKPILKWTPRTYSSRDT